MLVIPFRIDDFQYSVVAILGEDSQARIREYDPAEITINKLGAEWQRLRLKDVIVTIATPAEEAEVLRLCGIGKVMDALRLVTRGFRYRPNQGDHDAGPMSALRKPGETTQ